MGRNYGTEYAVEQHFVKRVKELGGFSLKSDRIDGRRFLDRIAFLPGGKVLVAELKRPVGGRLSTHQTETMRALTARGHNVALLKTKEEVDLCLMNAMNSRD
ncbi:MAG: hypothetical protein WCY29_05875 [Novosphingobium sp.]